MRKLLLLPPLLLPPLLLLSSCGAVSHVTDALTCIGVCQSTRIEHQTTPPAKGNNPKENQQ